jgi:malate dehydrogenase (quinone)
MSATLATLFHEFDPKLEIAIFERLEGLPKKYSSLEQRRNRPLRFL